ncbi:hypothetical protein BMF94_0836 [Rhodotorula taiwanensis]|uniref:Uncharacterized protein n=1 Tax=Rhodotorula taiwanensis TaxID=741276 RepID=A0A2S5BH89_9BASI|nr:hypothetical protein BMF94_0836 [Rhodotorula taiwanensis]
MLVSLAILVGTTLISAVQAIAARSAQTPLVPLFERADQRHFSLYDTGTSSGIGPVDLALPGSKIVRKELCYRNIYGRHERFEQLFEHQTPMQDAQGINFLLRDGFVHLVNGTETYVLEHCYPQDEPEALEDVNVCPVREGTSTSKWNRGISLHVDSGKRDWHVVFDQARFLDGFILPAERIPSDISSVGDELEGEEETDSDTASTIFEDEEEQDLDHEPFNPFADADFDFFAAFEQGYPGHDGCDEHGCWERKIVTGP